MVSTPKMEYQFFLHFPIGKFLWDGREKGLPCWLSQLQTMQGHQTSQNT